MKLFPTKISSFTYNPRVVWYGLMVVAIVTMVFSIEAHLRARYAPEIVLVSPPAGTEDTEVVCTADIYTEEHSTRGKSLRVLESIYEVLDPEIFLATEETGFHLLETGLLRYTKPFEIEIACSVPGEERFSYLIINQESQTCSFSGDGKILMC